MDCYFALLACKGNYEMVLILIKELKMTLFTGATMWVMQEVFDLSKQYMLCEPNRKEGLSFISAIMNVGNFGHYNPVFDTLIQLNL